MHGLFDRCLLLLAQRAQLSGPDNCAAILEACRESFILDWSLDAVEPSGEGRPQNGGELEAVNELDSPEAES